MHQSVSMTSPPQHRARPRRVRGFSLVELAIVLIIVGLLLSSLMPPLNAQIDQRNYNTTQRQIEEVSDAMVAFAVVNGRLPRPAVSISDGSEKPADCTSEADCTGFVPWATLGVRRTDAWNKMLRYSVTPAYASVTAFTLNTVGSKKVQTRNDSGVIGYLIGTASACSVTSTCAPAVIYSNGKSNWGISAEGIAQADTSTTNVDEDANEVATTIFVARNQSSVPTGGEFDDLVIWIPPYNLFNRMIAASKLP